MTITLDTGRYTVGTATSAAATGPASRPGPVPSRVTDASASSGAFR